LLLPLKNTSLSSNSPGGAFATCRPKNGRYTTYTSLGVPFSEALDSAETLIFENGDFATAVPILTHHCR
jgi:hypothetical protein